MSKQIVRCCCGHQVLAKEVLRTDLYERASGRDYIYVKYRCVRCKRMGQTFVAESRWDWSILEPARNEMNDAERDRFLDARPISAAEVLDFHCCLHDMTQVSELSRSARQQETPGGRGDGQRINPPTDAPGENTSRENPPCDSPRIRASGDESNRDPNLRGANGGSLPEDFSSTTV